MNAYREDLSPYIRERQLAVFENNCTEPKTMVGPHWHDAYEILFIRSGHGFQQFNAGSDSFHAGDLIIIHPGDIHATVAASLQGCSIDVLQFTPALFPPRSVPMAQLRSRIICASAPAISELFDALKRYFPDTLPGQELLMAGLIQMVIAFILRTEPSGSAVPLPSDAIQAICVHLEHAPNLHLKQVAAHFGYSSEHLSRKFRSELGISYRDYCNQIRMRRASSLLLEGKNISDVADQLGYSDESSFIRAFRNLYGITPYSYIRHRISIASSK